MGKGLRKGAIEHLHVIERQIVERDPLRHETGGCHVLAAEVVELLRVHVGDAGEGRRHGLHRDDVVFLAALQEKVTPVVDMERRAGVVHDVVVFFGELPGGTDDFRRDVDAVDVLDLELAERSERNARTETSREDFARHGLEEEGDASLNAVDRQAVFRRVRRGASVDEDAAVAGVVFLRDHDRGCRAFFVVCEVLAGRDPVVVDAPREVGGCYEHRHGGGCRGRHGDRASSRRRKLAALHHERYAHRDHRAGEKAKAPLRADERDEDVPRCESAGDGADDVHRVERAHAAPRATRFLGRDP